MKTAATKRTLRQFLAKSLYPEIFYSFFFHSEIAIEFSYLFFFHRSRKIKLSWTVFFLCGVTRDFRSFRSKATQRFFPFYFASKGAQCDQHTPQWVETVSNRRIHSVDKKSLSHELRFKTISTVLEAVKFWAAHAVSRCHATTQCKIRRAKLPTIISYVIFYKP